MSPLDMPEVLVVEGFRQCLVMVFEGMDGTVLGIEDGPVGTSLLHSFGNQTADTDSGVHGVPWVVDGAVFVEVYVDEVDCGMAVNDFGKQRVERQCGAEDGYRLQVGM